jgi:hypothetical protein
MDIWTTKVKTKDGQIYDLGKLQTAPFHERSCQCDECNVINAWTEKVR